MGLVRKSTLKQLIDIEKTMKDDIGVSTIKDYPKDHIDLSKPNDHEPDEVWDLSDAVNGEFNCGALGEFYGDLTNNNHYANILSIGNPFDNHHISTYEDFGQLYGFGDWWKTRPALKVQKFDHPDKELFESTKFKDDDTKKFKHLKKFNEM